MKKKSLIRGQVASEYIILLGIVFVITIPLLYYVFRESAVTVQLNQADETINALVKAADNVYAFGPGTKKYLWVNVPGGIRSSLLDNKTIQYQIEIFGGISDVFGLTQGDVRGTLPLGEGQHRIAVEMTSSGYVQIGEANDTSPPVVVYTSPKGTINYNGIVLKLATNEYSSCRYDSNDIDIGSMFSEFSGSALSHEKDLGILDNGNYTFFARCQDPSGNAMQSSAIINFTIVPPLSGNTTLPDTNETYEPYLPTVTLISPPTGYEDALGTATFSYNVTDNSSIWYCRLIINDSIKQTDFNVTRNTPQNFTQEAIVSGSYVWNVNCSDVHGNENSSLFWNFSSTSQQDFTPPAIQLLNPPDNAVKKTSVINFDYNTSDTGSNISSCSLTVAGTLSGGDPFSQSVSDDSVTENITQTFTLVFNNGNYSWNVSCADSSANANSNTSLTRKLQINASDSSGVSLMDVGVDETWYFKTDGYGLYTQDSQMASWSNITLNLLDDNVNTPPSTNVIRTRQNEKYEGFVAKVNEDSKSYTKIVLYGRVSMVDESPFFLRVYPYYQNGSVLTSQYAEFSINSSILTQKVKWVEMDITNIARAEDNFGWLRMRITSKNTSAQQDERFQFSELHYKVG
ncbi:hypothetical protein HYU14_05585 [Candidatus Woesearchaeota archaeon]|nr:hypothetical protein [Candidatus Woesearchaeota archaeon]